MVALNANGERPQALQAYQTLRAAMLDELGLEPGSDTQDLYLSILRGNPAERDRQSDRDEVRTLLELLEPDAADRPVQHHVLPTELVVRDSTGPVPA